MKHYIAIFTLGLWLVQGGIAALAQTPPCGTMPRAALNAAQHPEFLMQRQAIEEHTAQYVAKQAEEDPEKQLAVITIPVVVHVVYNTATQNISDEKIYSQIEALNRDYRRLNLDASNIRPVFNDVVADPEIEFCLATQTPDGLPTTGITRTSSTVQNFFVYGSDNDDDNVKFTDKGGHDAWPSNRYFNLWVVPRICYYDDSDNLICNEVLGYAQFPGDNPLTDGVVIRFNAFGTTQPVMSSYNEGGTATHEVGHWLNLRHTWGDDGGGCLQDDFVSDTPRSGDAHFSCDTDANTCNEGANDKPDMVENFMDYATDACSNSFTLGQKTRMRALFAAGGARYGLTLSQGCQVIPQGLNDAVALSMSLPTGTGNCTTISPTLEVRNFGTQNLLYLEVHYNANNGADYFTYWEGDLPPFESTTITLPPLYAENNGIIQTINVSLVNPNGQEDFSPENNTIQGTVATLLPGEVLPLSETFVDNAFPPAGWSGNGGYFERDASVGNGNAGAAFINNYGAAIPINTVSELHLADIDLKNLAQAYLSFDWAYAQRNDGEQPDRLEVLISTDCGESFVSLYNKSGSDLATVNATTELFAPSSTNDWKNETIVLNDYIGARNAIIAFRHTKGEGNNIYLDNINVFQFGVSVNTISPTRTLQLLPNPARELVRINLEQWMQQEPSTLTLYNMLGNIVQQHSLPHAAYTSLSLAGLPDGLYSIMVHNSRQKATAKLVIAH